MTRVRNRPDGSALKARFTAKTARTRRQPSMFDTANKVGFDEEEVRRLKEIYSPALAFDEALLQNQIHQTKTRKGQS